MGDENLLKAREHFFNGQRELILSTNYVLKFIKDIFIKNGRQDSPIFYMLNAGETVLMTIYTLIPSHGNGFYPEMNEDLKLLKKAVDELLLEVNASGLEFKPGSIEWKILNTLERFTSFLDQNGNGLKNSKKVKKQKVKID